MSLKIVRNDITLMKVDAIVNPTNSKLLGYRSTDGDIHRAAGPLLDEECEKIGWCDVGDAVITGGYNLPAKYIIHTVGPVWEGGENGERELLENCYRRCLEIAKEHKIKSIAFPVISSGTYGFPSDKAMLTANKMITEFLYSNEMEIYLVVYGRASVTIGETLFNRIEQYIDDNYVRDKWAHIQASYAPEYYESDLIDEEYEPDLYGASAFDEDDELFKGLTVNSLPNLSMSEDSEFRSETLKRRPSSHRSENRIQESSVQESFIPEDDFISRKKELQIHEKKAVKKARKIPSKLPTNFVVDEGFFSMVTRYIDEYGWKDSEFYKKANLNKSVFSKMKKDGYRPSKKTAVACALRLELSPDKVDELLAKAGYALSSAFLFDVIIKACIEQGLYNVFTVNQILFDHDQELLGY